MKKWIVSLAVLIFSHTVMADTLFIDNETSERVFFHYKLYCKENGELKEGTGNASAHQKDVRVEFGDKCNVWPNPENLLTVEYCKVSLAKPQGKTDCPPRNTVAHFYKNGRIEVFIR